MPRKARPALPAAVKRLQVRIEEWRRTRERRTRMAPELWAEAVVLSQREGVYPVARALRVNYEALKRRVSEAGACALPGAPRSEFVEVAGAQLLAAASTAGTVVEVFEGAKRLVMRLGREAALDVAQVVAAFVGRGA
jgi:hypothetical protein